MINTHAEALAELINNVQHYFDLKENLIQSFHKNKQNITSKLY